jgi:hypothetical protein
VRTAEWEASLAATCGATRRHACHRRFPSSAAPFTRTDPPTSASRADASRPVKALTRADVISGDAPSTSIVSPVRTKPLTSVKMLIGSSTGDVAPRNSVANRWNTELPHDAEEERGEEVCRRRPPRGGT